MSRIGIADVRTVKGRKKCGLADGSQEVARRYEVIEESDGCRIGIGAFIVESG